MLCARLQNLVKFFKVSGFQHCRLQAFILLFHHHSHGKLTRLFRILCILVTHQYFADHAGLFRVKHPQKRTDVKILFCVRKGKKFFRNFPADSF